MDECQSRFLMLLSCWCYIKEYNLKKFLKVPFFIIVFLVLCKRTSSLNCVEASQPRFGPFQFGVFQYELGLHSCESLGHNFYNLLCLERCFLCNSVRVFRHLSNSAACGRCGMDETCLHVLRDCSFVRASWIKLGANHHPLTFTLLKLHNLDHLNYRLEYG